MCGCYLIAVNVNRDLYVKYDSTDDELVRNALWYADHSDGVVKNFQASFCIFSDTFWRAEQLAKSKGISINELVENCISSYMKANLRSYG